MERSTALSTTAAHKFRKYRESVNPFMVMDPVVSDIFEQLYLGSGNMLIGSMVQPVNLATALSASSTTVKMCRKPLI
jgi:hypothetical protein